MQLELPLIELQDQYCRDDRAKRLPVLRNETRFAFYIAFEFQNQRGANTRAFDDHEYDARHCKDAQDNPDHANDDNGSINRSEERGKNRMANRKPEKIRRHDSKVPGIF